MDDVTRRLADIRLVPVVRIDDAAHAPPLADALVDGGLPVLEITFRTDAAEDAIRAVGGRSDVLVGAGTVINAEQARCALDAGARFLVAPGLDATVVATAQQAGVPCFPGVATPTDLTAAVQLGLDVVKLFPAETLGGLPMLKALAGPFPDVRFIPTGGIGPRNAAAWLALPNVLAVGGSWMAPPSSIAGGRFEEIRDLARAAIALVP